MEKFYALSVTQKDIVMKNKTTSLPFTLSVESDGWPPVGKEYLVANQTGKNDFEILVPPFFIQDISVGDIIMVELDRAGVVKNWEFKTKSKRSTIWVLCKDFTELEEIIELLKESGSNIERLKQFGLISIDVSDSISPSTLDEYLTRMEFCGANVVCPSFRH